eukprot:symbB.v1.2.028234.t1/scaffold2972.1/size66174/3
MSFMKLPKRCTDTCWIIPFIICFGIFIFVCSDALSKGDLSNLVRLPDLNGHLCGQGINRDKPFLYFCMQQDSQWVFQGNDKRLDMANPVCVGICPGTYNTSTRCWLPLNQSYAWVQDYPTQPFIGFLCRPSRKFTSSLSDQAGSSIQGFFLQRSFQNRIGKVSRFTCLSNGMMALARSLCAILTVLTAANDIQRIPFDARCFPDESAGSIDRSNTNITLLLQAWTSHELVTFTAAFILKEWLGYTVELVTLGPLPVTEEYALFQSTLEEGVWDVDLESWIEIQSAEHRARMGSLSEPFSPIGFSGRSGLYVMPKVVEEENYADWYKFYQQPGNALAAGFRTADPQKLRDLLGDDFPICKTEKYAWCGTPGFEGFFVPDHCASNVSSCILVEMGHPSWDQGFFEQVAQNLQLPFIFAYLGSEKLSDRRLELERVQEKVIWYSWSSNWGGDFYGGVRISLPDPASSSVVQGYIQYPNATLAVDYPEVVLVKLIKKTLFERAPEAYWLLKNFRVESNELLDLLGPTGTSSREERMTAACEWLKSKRDRILELTPSCSRNASDTGACEVCCASETTWQLGSDRTVYERQVMPANRDQSFCGDQGWCPVICTLITCLCLFVGAVAGIMAMSGWL